MKEAIVPPSIMRTGRESATVFTRGRPIDERPLRPGKCFFLTASVAGTLFYLCSCAGLTARWQVLLLDQTPHAAPFKRLLFTDRSHGWALAYHLKTTADGGRTWLTRLEATSELGFHSFTVLDEKRGWVVGEVQEGDATTHPLILNTTDGGESWQKQVVSHDGGSSFSPLSYLHSISMNGSGAGWAVGQNRIVRTDNSGESWKVQYNGAEGEYLYDIVCLSSERAWAVGNGGTIIYTEDAGVHWDHLKSATNAALTKIRFFGNTGWIMGTNGTLLRSDNGGIDWIVQKLPVSIDLGDCFLDNAEGWLVGAAGTILCTNDGGNSWTSRESPTSEDLLSLSFVTRNMGWAGGKQQTLLCYR